MAACVEPYPPPSSLAEVNYLVVDGFLNGTSRSAVVRLTRATPLAAAVPNPPEEDASVSVENIEGGSSTLSEVDEGIYQVDNLDVSPSSSYRLRIVTKSGSSYVSDYVMIRNAPVLDSVSWRPEPEGTRFYVSGHDPSNSTTYYRYLFTETWEYRVPYYSFWKKVGGLPVFRDPITEQVFTCWNSTLNTEVLTTSTRRLDSDIVSMFPINYIRKGSRMLSRTYSINVQQRAISQEEFEYWDQIRKTTESLGGLFDPLPSQVVGNIRSEDPGEVVLGYFGGAFVAEKRIFVNNADLPDDLMVVDGYDFTCELRFVPIDQPELAGADTFVEQIGQPPIGYTVAIPNCADCRSLGGENKEPSFWPQ